MAEMNENPSGNPEELDASTNVEQTNDQLQQESTDSVNESSDTHDDSAVDAASHATEEPPAAENEPSTETAEDLTEETTPSTPTEVVEDTEIASPIEAETPISEATTSEVSDDAPTAESSEEPSNLKQGESLNDGIDMDVEDELEDEEEDSIEAVDVTTLSKQELVALVDSVLKSDKIMQRARLVNDAKDHYDGILEQERKAALESFLAIEGNVEMDFQYPLQYIDRQWRDLVRQYYSRKKAIREAAVAEKEENLKKKQAIIDELKELSEKATEVGAFEKVRELQENWKKIGPVPSGGMDNLYKNYRFLNDKFFEQRALIREFQDYDRKKNLDTKKEIIESMEKLVIADSSLKDLMSHVRQLQESWKQAGPVPRENLDEIMEAYRAVNEKVTEKKNTLIAVVDGERKENQTKKEAIIEKVLNLLDDENELSWAKRNKALSQLIDEWKQIGAVPRSENERIRSEFSNAVKAFNKLKNTFFKEQKNEKMANLKLREEACEKVEAIIAEGGELHKRRDDIIKIQRYWKTIGYAPRKQSDELWERFRKGCNQFFDLLKQGDVAKNAEQEEAYKAKVAVCEAIEALAGAEEIDEEKVKELEEQWASLGYVPFSKKKEIDKRYKTAIRSVLAQTMKLGDVPAHLEQFQLKLEEMMRNDRGDQLIENEFQQIRKKVQKLNGELDTLETNIQFFSNSKGADKLLAPIQKQIDDIKGNLERHKEKQKLIRGALNRLRG